MYESIKNTGRLLQTFPLSNLYENHHLKVIVDKNVVTVYDGETIVINGYVLPDDGMDAYGYGPITCYKSHLCEQQSYFTFKNIVMQTIKGESLSDVVNGHDWTPGTNHYVINLSQTSVPELMDADRMADVVAALIQNDAMFFGLGNSNNIDQYNALVNAMDGKGSNIVISEEGGVQGSETEDGKDTTVGEIEGVKVDDAVDSIISQIVADVRSKDYSIGYTLVNDELVEYSGTYFDPDGDPAGAEEWEYGYDKSIFGVLEENSRQTIRCAAPITMFKQTGAYEISLRVSDNPAGENEALSAYVKWSDTDDYQKLILSHHRPVAKINTTVMESPDTSGMCIAGVTYEAYDEDHLSDSRRGIRGEEFCYKEINDEAWTEGRLPSCLPIGGTYLVKYVVKDIEGTNSRPAVCVIKTNDARNYKEPEDNTAPEVQLSVSAAVTEPGRVFYIEASATDDYGVVDFNVCVNGKEIAKSYGRYSYIPSSTGEFTITASATDICGNTRTETRTVNVVDKSDTTPPVIEVTSPKNGTVTGKVDIIGSITDNKQLKSYKVEFYDCNGNSDNSPEDESVYDDAVLIASGKEEIRNDKIAQFNVDSLLEGVYRIVITAEDMAGLVTVCTVFITIEEDKNADRIPPQAVISGMELSEDYSEIIITGTVCDETQISGYELVLYRFDKNGDVAYSRVIAEGNDAISYDVLGIICTETLESGRYRIELKVNDLAGNSTTAGAGFEYTASQSGEGAGEINRNDDCTEPVILTELTTKIIDEGIYIRLEGLIEDDNLQLYKVHTGKWNEEDNGYELFCISSDTENVSDEVIAEYTYAGVKAGDYIVKAEAIDTAGNIRTVEYTFTVTEEGYIAGEYVGDEPKEGESSKDKLSFILGIADGDISEPVPVYISYPKGAEDITLTVNGNGVEIDGRTASITADSAGSYEVVLSAVINGEIQTVSDTIRFYDKTDVIPPEACFTSPEPDSIVKTVTDITGTVSDNQGIAYYTLEYRRDGTDSYKKISSGTEPVHDGVLGKIDTTLLMNGRYTLRLTVVDHGGHRIRTERAINVEGNLKVGNMSIGFTDICTDVSGLPLTLNRYYDSRNKVSGDFGIGWSLGIQSVNLIESSDIRQGYQLVQTGNRLSTAYYLVQTECHDITVAYGDGTSDRFELTVTPDRQGLLPICEVEVHFTCVTNPNVSLFLDGDNRALVYGSQLIFEDDTLFDKQSYVLERTDGTKLYLDSERGLKKMEDSNGNTVTISSGGYKHSNGTGIAFERDTQGRIVSATETRSGVEEPVNRTEYAYDSRNNLISVTNIAGKTVAFTYDDDHNMTGIIDPSGMAVARNEYDEEGRLIATVDADGSRITYTHNMDERQEVVRDRRGNVTVYTYDENGNIIRIVDALGNVTEKTYDENNNLLTATDALGNVITFEYDERNNLIKSVDALGQITAMEYGTRNEILKITQSNLLSVFMTYDKKGNIISSTDTAGNVTEYSYESNGSLKSISDSIGTVMTLTYDSTGRVATSTDGVGNTVTYAYDNKGNCISTEFTKQTEEGSVSIRNLYFYDASGNVVKTMDSLGGEETLEYDENGRIKAMTDEKGIRTSYGYDSRGNVTSVYYADGTAETFTYDADGNLLTSTDRLNLTRIYEYDKLGRNVSITLPDGNQVRYEYDAVGNLTGYLSVTGAKTTYGYDKLGRNTSVTDDDGNSIVYTYGASSELLSVTDKMGRTTAYGYDNAGNVISITYADGSVYGRTYDARSRLVSETDAEGNVTTYGYDNADRLISVTDALGNKTKYEYDNLGELQKITDARGSVTTYAYDTLGRRISDTDALGHTHTYEYSETGNLVSETSYSGTVTEYFYDEYDRLVRKSVSNSGTGGVNAGSSVTTYTRDAYGRITDITDESGMVSYQYDELGRIKCVTGADGITLWYGYDGYGRKVSVTAVQEGAGKSAADGADSDGIDGINNAETANTETVYGGTYYVYDKFNRLVQVSDMSGNHTEYFYNVDDTLARETCSNGIVTMYGYDECGSLSSMKYIDTSNRTVEEYQYTRGADGEITKITECVLQADGTVMEKVTEYTYDSVKRLIREVIRDEEGIITFRYGYDESYNRISQEVQFAGNVDGLLDETGREEVKESEIAYTFNVCNQLVKETRKNVDGTVTEKAYIYDTDGNLVQEYSESGTKTYGYDVKGHMVSAVVEKTIQSMGGTETAEQVFERSGETYGYDAEGVRIWKETDGARTIYTVDKLGTYSQILVERKGTGEVYYYTRGNQMVCRTERTDTDIADGNIYAEVLYHGKVRLVWECAANNQMVCM